MSADSFGGSDPLWLPDDYLPEVAEERANVWRQRAFDLRTSNRINQDALAWVKSVVMDDDMPAADRMATLRHHFERGTFPVELFRRRA